MGDWLHATVNAWRRLASDVGIAIQLDMPEHPLPVMAASSYLELVIGNLLDNAIKFSPKGSKITLCTRTDDDNVLIAVADQGSTFFIALTAASLEDHAPGTLALGGNV
jgi:signal transduction histidine kinase